MRISRQLVSDLKIAENEFRIEGSDLVERDPKTENSMRILKVPKAVMKEVQNRQNRVQMYKERLGSE